MKLLIANLILWGSIGAYALPSAIDSELDSKQASNIGHRYDNIDNQADLDDEIVYQVSDNKAYKMIDGLASNEWAPLTADGYVDDYDSSDKAKEIKAANAKLRKIRGDL